MKGKKHIRMKKGTSPTLSNKAEQMNYSPGETIIAEGEPGSCMFIMVSGTVRCLKGKREVKVLTSGDYFGELAVVNDRPRAASIVSHGAWVYVMPFDQLSEHLIGSLKGKAIYKYLPTAGQRDAAQAPVRVHRSGGRSDATESPTKKRRGE